MDQPRDDKKGHVNLNVHTTTEGDRHPITQYNVWSRPSVEYHLPTRSKSSIVVMEWRYCQTRSSRVICDSTAVQQKAQSHFDSSSTSNETSCRYDFCQPLRLQHGPDSKSKRQNLSDHRQSPEHPSPRELSVSIWPECDRVRV